MLFSIPHRRSRRARSLVCRMEETVRSLLQNQGVLEQTAVDTVDIMKAYKVNQTPLSQLTQFCSVRLGLEGEAERTSVFVTSTMLSERSGGKTAKQTLRDVCAQQLIVMQIQCIKTKESF